MNSDSTTQNRGLINMKYRADQLKANIHISFGESGSKVNLILKMKRI
jgi:hypothetical protein